MILAWSNDLALFARESLAELGVPKAVRSSVAAALSWASLSGVDSHGIDLLPAYFLAVQNGKLRCGEEIPITGLGQSMVSLDAAQTFGHFAVERGVELASEAARATGVGCSLVRNSSHCGALGYYANKIASAGLVGIVLSNARPRMRSYGGTQPYVGTNPICVSAPIAGDEPFCFDSALTQITFNGVRRLAGAGRELEKGIASDEFGSLTTDPRKAVQLEPIGAHKGFGLAIAVEVLTLALAGGLSIGNKTDSDKVPLRDDRGIAQTVFAINPDSTERSIPFGEALSEFARALRQQPAIDPNDPVQMPGDPEKNNRKVRAKSGVPISAETKNALDNLAREAGIEPLRVFNGGSDVART